MNPPPQKKNKDVQGDKNIRLIKPITTFKNYSTNKELMDLFLI